MKQFIIMTAMVVLGVFIYNLIAGDGESSISNALAGLWHQGIEVRTYTP